MRLATLAIRLTLAAVLVGGCQPKKPPPPTRTMTEWTITNHNPADTGTALIWNGSFGVRISRLGLSATMKPGEFGVYSRLNYEQSGEERIIGMSNPFPTMWWVDGKTIDPSQVSEYEQKMDFQSGKLVTRFQVGGTKLMTTWCAVEDAIFVTVDPGSGTPSVEIASGKISQRIDRATTWKLTLRPDGKQLELGSAPSAPTANFDRQADIEIEGPVEDQLFVRSALFHLHQSLLGGSGPVSPMMASSGIYFGHQFWDADVWVLPAMAMLYPDSAREIAAHRIERLAQARRNMQSALSDPNIPWGDPAQASKAAMFPWESSVSGKETVPGSSKYQHHISGTVAWSVALAADLALVPESSAREIGEAVAHFWLARAKMRPDGLLGIERVMSPDEFHTGDNDLYTNMVAQWVLDRYLPGAGAKFYLPRDSQGFLTYDGDRGKGYKQTAALLSLFPLQNALAEAEAETMFNRYYDKTVKAGPAMSDCVHALIAARLGKTDLSYKLWRASWQDFTQDPLMLFSEKRRQSRTYFTTGAAGSLNAVLYGFAGIRLDEHEPQNVIWKRKLRGKRWISITPHLPKAWKQITLRGVSLPSATDDVREKFDITLGPNRVSVSAQR